MDNDNISISDGGIGMSGSSDIKEAPFWLVWSEGSPSSKYYKKGDAMLEAARLAKTYIGTAFYIAEVQFGYISRATTTKIHLVEGEV